MIMSRPKVQNTGGYDDSITREKVIKFLKEVFDLNMISNPNKTDIDLLNKEDNTWGAEVEWSKSWHGDFFSDRNKGLNNKSGLGFKTVNIPWWRKFRYWATENTGKDKNLYVRCNNDYTQIIVVEALTFHNPEMCLESYFKTNWITTGDVEEWRSFRREHVRVFNLIDGYYKEEKINVNI